MALEAVSAHGEYFPSKCLLTAVTQKDLRCEMVRFLSFVQVKILVSPMLLLFRVNPAILHNIGPVSVVVRPLLSRLQLSPLPHHESRSFCEKK